MAHAAGEGGLWRTTAARYALVPLRVFLGATFIYAGLDKLSDPGFLADSGPGSLIEQLHGVENTAAIPAMIELALRSPDAFGLAIAFGELAVGLGTLFGLLTRLAALGGALISLSLWLTVSWQVQPYYLGNDLAYLMAWLPLLLAGAPLLSVDALLARRRLRLEDAGAEPGKLRRRSLLGSGLAAVLLGAAGALAGGFAMRFGQRRDAASKDVSVQPGASSSPGTTGTGTGGRGTVAASAVPVGGAARTVVPGSGDPAYIVQPEAGSYAAFSAVCTHQGCEVRAPRGGKFNCPCHGSEFDAATGKVLTGPATAPLPRLNVRKAGDRLELQ